MVAAIFKLFLDLFPLTKLTFTVLYYLLVLLFTCAVFNLWLPVCVPAHGVSMKSVRSSCVWNGLILHLKSSVAVKPRRLYLKSYSDCFLGSEAVDVLEEYLKGLKGLEGTFDEGARLYSNIWQTSFNLMFFLSWTNNCLFELVGVSVPRPKVVCVCRTLLDCRVFEAVGTKVFGKDRKQDPFQDSKSALYRWELTQPWERRTARYVKRWFTHRFVRVCTPSLLELERSALANGIQNLFCHSPSDRYEPLTHTHTHTLVEHSECLPSIITRADPSQNTVSNKRGF